MVAATVIAVTTGDTFIPDGTVIVCDGTTAINVITVAIGTTADVTIAKGATTVEHTATPGHIDHTNNQVA